MTRTGMVLAGLIRHRRLRSLISILSVTIAIGLLTMSLSVTKRLSDISRAFDNGRLIVQPKLSKVPLTLRTIDQLKKIPGVIPVHFASYFVAKFDGYSFGVMSWDPDIDTLGPPVWWSSTPEAIACWKKNRQGMIVSDKTMRRLGWHVGQTITSQAAMGPVETTICGVSTGYNPGHVYVHYDYVDQHAAQAGLLSFIFVECDTPDRRCDARMAQTIDDATRGSDAPTLTQFEQQNLARIMRTLSAVPQLLSTVSLVVVLITILISASTLAMSLEERRGEFGTLRALGFRRRSVLSLILAESTMLCMVGGFLGAVVPFWLYHERGISFGPSLVRDVTIDLRTCLLSLFCALSISVLVAILPGLRMFRDDVVSALEHG